MCGCYDHYCNNLHIFPSRHDRWKYLQRKHLMHFKIASFFLLREVNCIEKLCYSKATLVEKSKIVIQKNRTSELKLVLLYNIELQLCEGEMRGVRRMTLRPTHTQKKIQWWVKWENELGVSLYGLKTEGNYNECLHWALNQTPLLLLLHSYTPTHSLFPFFSLFPLPAALIELLSPLNSQFHL